MSHSVQSCGLMSDVSGALGLAQKNIALVDSTCMLVLSTCSH